MFITLKPLKVKKGQREPDHQPACGQRLRMSWGSTCSCKAVQDVRVGGRLSKAQYQYALVDGDLNELNHWSALLVDKFSKIPGIKDVTSDQQTRGLQANVIVDRDAASRLGISPASIDNTLYDAFGQRQVSVIYEEYNQHHVVLEVDPKFQMDPSSLSTIYVKGTNGCLPCRCPRWRNSCPATPICR